MIRRPPRSTPPRRWRPGGLAPSHDAPSKPGAEGGMSFDVAAVRRQFPILAEIIDGRPAHYLDNGASAQTPLAVLEAVPAHGTTGPANRLRRGAALAERPS